MTHTIGLDLHCKDSRFFGMEASGQKTGEGTVPTTPAGLAHMLQTLQAPPGTRIGMETGTQSFWVSRLLAALDMAPVIIKAGEVRQKARRRRQKTDARDAFEICDGLRRGIYNSIVYVPDAETQRLRDLLSRRRHFVRVSTQQVNAAKFILRARGLRALVKTLTADGHWKTLIEHPGAAEARTFLEMHWKVWRVAQENIQAMDKELEKAVKPFQKVADHLQTVPGVGPVVATTLIATLGTPTRFPTSRHVVSYLGLAPSTNDSGDRTRHGKITKEGSSPMRSLLCEAAQHARWPNHPFHAFFLRVCFKHGYRRAIIAVAQRLARLLYHLWLAGEPYDSHRQETPRCKLRRAARKIYRLKERTVDLPGCRKAGVR